MVAWADAFAGAFAGSREQGGCAMPRIYVIEDDEAIRTELMALLEREGYEVLAPSGFEALADKALAADPDAVLLDLTLPGTDGQLVCRELRQRSDVPVLVLTARNSEADEILAMSLGADDFLAKPYRGPVLLAHLEALLRRSGKGSATAVTLERSGVSLDLARSQASFDGATVELTKNELKILVALMRANGAIVSRAELMRELWDSDCFVDDNTLTVNINRLRATLEKIGVRDLLRTHRGQGYSVA